MTEPAKKPGAPLHLFNPLVIKIITEGGSIMDYRMEHRESQQFLTLVRAFPIMGACQKTLQMMVIDFIVLYNTGNRGNAHGKRTDKSGRIGEAMKVLLTSAGLETEELKEYFVNMIGKDMSSVKALFIPTAAIDAGAICCFPDGLEIIGT